jgi:hypothetical protein
MNEGNITVTLTESQHELIVDLLNHAMDAANLIMPYGAGSYDLPMDNEIMQRYTMIENLRETFIELWSDRWSDVPVEELSQEVFQVRVDAL